MDSVYQKATKDILWLRNRLSQKNNLDTVIKDFRSSQRYFVPDPSFLQEDITTTMGYLNIPFDRIAVEFPVEVTKQVGQRRPIDRTILQLTRKGNRLWMAMHCRFVELNRFMLSPYWLVFDPSQASIGPERKITVGAALFPILPENSFENLLGVKSEMAEEIFFLFRFLHFLHSRSCHCTGRHGRRETPVEPLRAIGTDAYKVITIQKKKESYPTGQTRQGVSPREHERSGHYRELKSGKRVWVRNCVVNKNKPGGRIDHDYRL